MKFWTREDLKNFTDAVEALREHAHTVLCAWADAPVGKKNTISQVEQILDSLCTECKEDMK